MGERHQGSRKAGAAGHPDLWSGSAARPWPRRRARKREDVEADSPWGYSPSLTSDQDLDYITYKLYTIRVGRKRVTYYVDHQGKSPILDYIDRLSVKEQQKVLAYISLLEERGEELRRPIADSVGEKLYELRPKAHRVLYFFMLREYAVVVHIFRKKTNRIPASEKDTALKRMNDFVERFRRGEIILGGEGS